MTRPILVPFKAEHMLAFVDHNSPILEEMRFATRKEKDGPAFTGLADGHIIGCAGVIPLWPGVGYAWVSLDKSAEAYGIWVTRTIRAVLRDIVGALHLHRVEAVVYLDSPRELRWIELLGFRRERQYATAYTPDKRDVVRFELIS